MEQNFPKQDNSPSFLGIMFLIFLIVAVIIVAALYVKNGLRFGSWDDLLFKKEQEQQEAPINITYHRLELRTDAITPVRYILLEDGVKIVEDTILPDVRELHSKAIWNRTYTFGAWSNMSYYYAQTSCKVLSDMICEAKLKPIGNYTLTFANNRLTILKQADGYFQKPLLCMAWTYDIYLVSAVGYEKAAIPFKYKNNVDVCYPLGDDIQETKDIDIDVKRLNPKVSEIEFYLLDIDANDNHVQTYNDDTGFPNLYLKVKV